MMISKLEYYAIEQKNLDFLEMKKIPSWIDLKVK